MLVLCLSLGQPAPFPRYENKRLKEFSFGVLSYGKSQVMWYYLDKRKDNLKCIVDEYFGLWNKVSHKDCYIMKNSIEKRVQTRKGFSGEGAGKEVTGVWEVSCEGWLRRSLNSSRTCVDGEKKPELARRSIYPSTTLLLHKNCYRLFLQVQEQLNTSPSRLQHK